ncbi:MAG: deoxyribose-phosphate aldolase [Acidobacteria bacterium]|nr:deoxyribose-phosphate aldolase [Acidobacteriota bacterium]
MSTNTIAAAEPQKIPFLDAPSLARRMDHSLVLRADVTSGQVTRLCEEAAEYGFAAVFVHPCYVALATSILRVTPVHVGTPVGFPYGGSLTTTKRFEAAEALRLGASELDMVMNIAALKSGDQTLVAADIKGVVEIAHDAGAIVKVILETPVLTIDEKLAASQLCVAAGADYVKTCTGLVGPATVEDVALLCGVVGGKAGVKASGGIRTLATAAALVEAGADRLGTSSAVEIMREFQARSSEQS